MKLPKGIVYVLLAGLAGLVATVTIHRYVTAKTRAAVKPTNQVVVAANDISPGVALNGLLMKVATWPQELIPPKSATTLQEVEGRVLITPVNKGEPILFNKLAPEGTSAGLGGLLDDSKRALTVRVDDVSGVAGFVNPGDHVDVLVEMQVPNSQEHFSKTILQNIVVLTAGQFWEQNKEQKPIIVNTVTLEVTPDQAEILNLASNQGKIRLALRSRRNSAAVQTSGVDTSNLIGRNLTKGSAKNPSKGCEVEVIKGLKRSQAIL